METPIFIVITIYFNCVLGVADRVLQICYYSFTKKNEAFEAQTAENISLTFILLPFGINFILMLAYCLFHHEEQLTIVTKIKSFFLYLISTELLHPIGIQMSFKTKYSESADNPIVTMRLVNGLHVMFISIPQLLIISINSSAHERFENLDIASLIISSIFIVWSGVYYVLCNSKEADYDDYVTLAAYKNE